MARARKAAAAAGSDSDWDEELSSSAHRDQQSSGSEDDPSDQDSDYGGADDDESQAEEESDDDVVYVRTVSRKSQHALRQAGSRRMLIHRGTQAAAGAANTDWAAQVRGQQRPQIRLQNPSVMESPCPNANASRPGRTTRTRKVDVPLYERLPCCIPAAASMRA